MATEQQIITLTNSYNKESIQRNWLIPVSKFYIHNQDKIWQNISGSKMVDLLANKKIRNKQEIADFSFSVLLNKEIYHDFIASLPEYIPPIIEKLLWLDYLSKEELVKFYNKPVLFKSRPYGHLETALAFGIFELNVDKNNYYSWQTRSFEEEYKIMDFSLSLKDELKDCIREFYSTPEGYHLKEYFPEIDDKSLKIFNADPIIHDEIPKIAAYASQDNIKYSEKGKPNAAGMSKMQRMTGISEFFVNKELLPCRSMIIAGLFYSFKQNKMAFETVNVISSIFNAIFFQVKDDTTYHQPTAPYLLTRLKGINYFFNYDYNTDLSSALRAILLLFPPFGWVSYDNIFTYLKAHRINCSPLSKYNIVNKITIDVMQDRGYYGSNRPVKRSEIVSLIEEPYIKGHFFLLASLGIVEIAYTEVDINKIFGKDWYSEYDGLKAIRLTELGKHILGLNETYKAPERVSNKLIFDENSLIVRAEGDMELIQTVLGNYVTKASNNRYSFDTGFFLKDCKTGKDIVKKIALFKQIIGTKLPKYWENYLASLVLNANLVRLEQNMLVFELPMANKALHHLIATDIILKKIILKAEQFKIIVTKSNLLKFKNRMKELGFFVSE